MAIFRRTLVARAITLVFASSDALAIDTLASVDTRSTPFRPGERLSEWLVRASSLPAPDTSALHWRVEAEKLPQRQLRDAALAELSQLKLSTDAQAAWDAMSSLPLTGRLPLYTIQALALRARPDQDPVLQNGHSVVLFARPRYVGVILSSGRVCLVPHGTGLFATDYIAACHADAERQQTSRVGLAQPDAHQFNFGVAPWNLDSQDEPAPGAWLWAPFDAHRIPSEVSRNFVRFLATQPPLEHLQDTKLYQRTITLARPVTPVDHARPLGAAVSYNDWGEGGLLQTPSARMGPASGFRFHLSRVWPYTRGTVMFHPIDGLEGGFRYTDIANKLYGPVELSGNQTYKDKSFDVKLRLAKESELTPELALGIRDFGGTGLFSSEYLVASKRWGALDFSLGMGWGNVAGRANIRNPLSAVLGSQWNTRPNTYAASNGSGGTVGFGAMFKGQSAFFGGVKYSASDKLLLKAELDGNNYKNEPFSNSQAARSPFNFGLTYQYSPTVDWSVGLERGNRVMASLTLHTDTAGLSGLYTPKPFDPPLPALRAPETVGPLQMSLDELLRYLSEQTGWQARIINLDGDTATLVAEAATAIYIQDRVERATRALNAVLPPDYRRFVVQLRELGMPLATVTIDREEWVAKRLKAQAPSLQLEHQQLYPGNQGFKRFDDINLPYADGVFRVVPSFNQIIGGPDGFVLYAAGMQALADYRLSKGTWLVGSANLRIVDNFDKFKYTAPSNLPRVRTYQREYATTSAVTIPFLQLTHVSELGGGHFASVYGGMLEPMFGGVGGEWFYRPWQSRLAVGVDVNHVRQRDFRQNMAFRDYKVNTGHASVYWDTGFKDLHATVSVGRYLAGDTGATVDVKRVFPNGVSVGAWATKTNVSTAQFGEGSFDKGIYLNMPFDVLLPRSAGGTASMVWNPLTRDGGARLFRRFPLNEVTRLRSPEIWRNAPAAPSELLTAANLSQIEPTPRLHPLADTLNTTKTLGSQIAGISAEPWLWAGGAVLASSLLDGRVDRWAQNHATGSWKKAGSIGNAMPYLLAAGSGALYLGLGGEHEATTAETALRAGAYTLAANYGVRYIVGRQRPLAGQGNASFNGLTNSALQSGFTSNHTAIAFALATPFAQQFDSPWLYGLAAAAAFGRIQKRDHWLSDTVAGAAMGYGMGTLLNHQQNKNGKGVSISIAPNAVVAHWQY